MKGKITTQRILRRGCISAAMGMANETRTAKAIYSEFGWLGLIIWRTLELEQQCEYAFWRSWETKNHK